MNKIVIATLCFAAGAGFGFLVGYSFNKKENDEDSRYAEPIPVESKSKEEPKKEEPRLFSSKPARIAMPGEDGINYSKFVKDLQYKLETQSPPDDDPDDIQEESEIDMEQYTETFEERLERESKQRIESAEQYKKEHAGKIELMTEDDWDTDFPETDYEREDLYYFVESDVLTNEDGEKMDEKETIGPKVRQVGWMRSPDHMIYVRNHPKEKEYRIIKEDCAVEDWF